jgi:ATP-dependent DNA helicase RecG
MVHPEFRVVQPDTPLPQALTPVYPSTAALPQAYLRKAVASALARAPWPSCCRPRCCRRSAHLRDALHCCCTTRARHTLATLEDHSHPAWQRLKFEELLAQQLSQAQARRRERCWLRRHWRRHAQGPARPLLALPFALTAAQQRVVAEIGADLARPRPMHRLLQGDVGSGKTVVAALAAAVAIDAAGSAR